MSGPERDRNILVHIGRYCAQISATVERFGDDQALFEADFIYQNAVAMCLTF